jgi:hypothetical protein
MFILIQFKHIYNINSNMFYLCIRRRRRDEALVDYFTLNNYSPPPKKIKPIILWLYRSRLRDACHIQLGMIAFCLLTYYLHDAFFKVLVEFS